MDFISLLKEKSVDRHARWAEAKKKVDSEPRYKAVESSAFREDYFREYCRMVKEERKKEKDAKDKGSYHCLCRHNTLIHLFSLFTHYYPIAAM